MALHPLRAARRLRSKMRSALAGPQVAAALPIIALLAYWFGGERYLLIASLGTPLMLFAIGGLDFAQAGRGKRREATLAPVDQFFARVDWAMSQTQSTPNKSACFYLEVDEFDILLDRFGQTAMDRILAATAQRIIGALRANDLVCQLEENRFGIIVDPVPHMDLDIAIGLARRFQAASEEPLSLDSTTVYISVSIGFCLATQAPSPTGHALAKATSTALAEARRHAPSALRGFSPELHHPTVLLTTVAAEAAAALENGQIQPWFQPQVATRTSHVTGFEALARWSHPEKGLISPAEFLPALADQSKLARLSEVMLYHSLNALKSWDVHGLSVPRIGVNFSQEELRDPRLAERIEWELDRFELAPERLAVEILETVVATSHDDTIARNISALARLGCHIDLDDFGIGHASISSIRRFAVQRLKIDRSFVMKVDRDPDQQRMVSAILLMADRLGLETLAEGVETDAEHAMLAQLGCDEVQGFGVARPMPLQDTFGWVAEHEEHLSRPPTFLRKSG